MSSYTDWNQKIIEEFRANGGKVGGNFAGATLVLLHTIGAKSGEERVTPVVCIKDGDRVVVFASKAGAPTHPHWYHNILAHPQIKIELGTQTLDVQASIAEEPERTRLYNSVIEVMPGFEEYRQKTSRVIPVVILTPVK